ncbi:hypothetical protein HID58_034089 [Brassica napus]|uniref:Uncharacterized protein n=1 Tax=Brassica napus TaxID=3708 RepID=A0ABQ8C158_BRANA|nr:hypothetical protein HID58_034089 [Brassica napus]
MEGIEPRVPSDGDPGNPFTRDPGIRGSESCLEAGGNNTGIFFPNSLPFISRLCHRSRGITCALKSTGVAHAQQAPFRQDPIPMIFNFFYLPGDDKTGALSCGLLNRGDINEIIKVPTLWSKVLAGKGASLATLPRDSNPRLAFPSDTCKEFLGFFGSISSFLPPFPFLSIPKISRDLHIPTSWLSFRRFFLPSASEMGTELGPDSSSIGSRVRSNSLRAVPAESMDSSDSFLDLTAAVNNPKALVTRNTLPVEGSQYPPIGPPSVIGDEEVAIWRKKYKLPDDVVIRAPEPGEVVSDFGIDEVPVYEEWRYYLLPRSKEPPVREVPKKERKKLMAFEGNWTEKFAFSHLPGFLATWRLDGRDTIEQVSKFPFECRQVSFLVSEAMSRSKGDEALAEYKRVLELPLSELSPPRMTKFSSSGSSAKDSPSAPYDWATVLNNLNRKVFLSTPVLLASEEDSSTAIQSLQGDLLEVASQLYHLGEKMEFAVSTKVEMDNLTSPTAQGEGRCPGQGQGDQGINQEDAGELAAAENASLMSQLNEREEELIDLKDIAATFDVDKTMSVNGAKIVARWELMREWLSGQTDAWDPATTLEQTSFGSCFMPLGPMSPIDGGFQRFHEACGCIHPLEEMCLEVSYLLLVPVGSSLPRGFCRGVRAPLAEDEGPVGTRFYEQVQPCSMNLSWISCPDQRDIWDRVDTSNTSPDSCVINVKLMLRRTSTRALSTGRRDGLIVLQDDGRTGSILFAMRHYEAYDAKKKKLGL